MRFKKGDRVVYTAAHEGYSEPEYKGTKGVVIEDDGGPLVRVDWGAVNPCKGVYRANVELVPSAAAASTFKVGDKVRVVKAGGLPGGSHHTAKIGDEFEVTSIEFADGQTEYHTNRWYFYAGEIELVEDDWDFDPRKPLVIQAGKFYRTRDGRKVGPMVDSGCRFDREYPFTIDGSFYDDGYGKAWRADGTFLPGKGAHAADLVAEWTTSCAAAEVDNLRDEYGPFTKPAAAAGNDNGKWKFKVGDFLTKENWRAEGYEVKEIRGNIIYLDDTYGGRAGYDIDDDRLLLVEPVTTATPAIVALIKDGQPRPATEPHVHPSRGHAQDEAGRLSRKYPGKEFGVYELVSTIQQKPAYDHEWQRLAASGEKIAAIKELRGLTGMGLRPAKDAVEYFLDAA